MGEVVAFPEAPREWNMCPECGGINFKMQVEGLDLWDRIVMIECCHCGEQRDDKFALEVEVEVELETSST